MKKLEVITSEPTTWSYCLTEEASARVREYAEQHNVLLTVAAMALLIRGELLLNGEDCEHEEMLSGSTLIECVDEIEEE